MKYYQVRKILLDLYENYSKLTNNEVIEIYSSYLKNLRRLAYKNNANAQYDLAGHYENIGFWGIPNPYFNSKKRFYWYSRSASNNFPEALNNLAQLYEKGEPVAKSLEKALELYKKGAELGSENCKKNFKILKKNKQQ
ncbi:MAG: hypothetical protein LCH67_12670 [Bacteroidetes bacterium]|nr:hypothetical protein [Bacteroidota bacterium]